MTLYYHTANFSDFNNVPETASFTEDIGSALAGLSAYNSSDFPSGNGYIHAFSSDEPIETSLGNYSYQRSDGTVIATNSSNTTDLITTGELYHVGTYLVPMSAYYDIVNSYPVTNNLGHNFELITSRIGNYISRT